MKFIVTRTSGFNRKPCRDAYKTTVDNDGLREQVYCVDINSLEELLAFVKKHGQIIVNEYYWSGKDFEIEIYDDYRE